MAVENNQENTQLSLNNTAYEFDYFSGSQISMYVGDVLIDDLVSIQFQATQGKRPIYGYASQYFDAVANGQVIVEGSLTINFKESDYLIATLKRYTEKMPIEIDRTVEAGQGIASSFLGPTTSSQIKTQHIVNRENIERRLQRQAKGQEETGSPYEFYQDLAALPDDAFENAAEAFEDKLWKNPENFATGNIDNVLRGTLRLQGDAGATETLNTYRRADQYPPIDIWILYGDISNKAANHTIKKLEQVHILGSGQAISAGGENILEQYRFFAKNLV